MKNRALLRVRKFSKLLTMRKKLEMDDPTETPQQTQDCLELIASIDHIVKRRRQLKGELFEFEEG